MTRPVLLDHDPALPSAEEAPRSHDLKELALYGLGRSKWIVAGTSLVGTSLAVLLAASIPNNYTASGILRYTPGLREQQMSPEASAGMDVALVAPSVVAELFLLNDPAVFRSVADEYGPFKILDPEDPTQYDDESTNPALRGLHELQKKLLTAQRAVPEGADREAAVEAAAKQLRADTVFTPVPRSSIIDVTHTSSSKERAVEILDLILDACVARHREQYHTKERLDDIRAREAVLLGRLEEARTAFRAYREESSIDDVEKARGRIRVRIDSLDRQIVGLESTIASTTSELEFLQELLDSIEPDEEVIEPEIRSVNPRYQTLVAEKERAMIDLMLVKKDEVLSFEEKKRQVVALEETIAAYDRSIGETEPFVVERLETSKTQPNPRWVELAREVRVLEGRQRASGSHLKGLQDELEEENERMEYLRSIEAAHAAKREDVEASEREYERVAARADELEDLMRLDEAGAANLSRYLDPRRPEGKDGPPRGKIAAVGLIMGMMLGVGLAVLRQLLDSRVRYPGTVEREFGIRVLSTVPELRTLRRLTSEPAAKKG